MKRSTADILAEASSRRDRGIDRSPPPPEVCVQKQLKYLTLWTEAMERGKQSAKSGKDKEALKELLEAERCYRLYRDHGGRDC